VLGAKEVANGRLAFGQAARLHMSPNYAAMARDRRAVGNAGVSQSRYSSDEALP
jgi:hypothetical protein